ncbi:hypothetical protein GGF40_003217 [Coemansia sp. RSA 1286]|nr:hypothetical protein GGF40_003217 [Coemansia sp. RSA 1286]
MLRYAASVRTQTTVANTTLRGASHISKAAYHHKPSSHGSRLASGGGGKWSTKLLHYVQNSVRAFFGASPSSQRSVADTAARSFMRTAAGKLSAKAPRVLAKRLTVKQLGNASMHLRSVFRQLVQKAPVFPGASRFAGRMVNPGSWAFGSGGKWYPYLKTLTQGMRLLTGPGNVASARVVLAQMQRQVIVAGGFSQQRRDLSSVSPLAQGTKISLVKRKETLTSAASRFAKEASNAKGTAAVAQAAEDALDCKESDQLHAVAKAAQQAASVPIDRCVTITIPYTISTSTNNGQQDQTALANVAQLISDMQQMQQRHSLLLSRLTEKLAATGWALQYHHLSTPTDSLRIAVPPESGILSAADLESLLLDWGFDMSLFAATICDPVCPPPASPAVQPSAVVGNGASDNGSLVNSSGSEDIDSRLFSLIVDQVVDPEEAYREEVRDFLAQIEQMPRLNRNTTTSSSLSKTRMFANRNAAGNAFLPQQKQSIY